MSKKVFKNISVFWTLFIGLGAVGGALCMFIDPTGATTGMAGLLPGLHKMPFADVLFTNLIFSGIALLTVNGITQLTAFAMIMKKHANAPKFVIGCGAVLMLWISIQFIIFPLNFLSTAYFIFGLLELICGVCYLRRASN